jgi:riboflavin synthase
MFTGIIQSIGHITSLSAKGGDARLRIDSGDLDMGDVALGDSIATNGVCLTVVELNSRGFAADLSRETLSLSTLHQLKPGSRVNLEKALTLNARLGGHLVSGHVDAIGQVLERSEDARSIHFSIEAPSELAKYIAHKGSICVDGVSLTVNAVRGTVFELNIVPHTLQQTIMGDYQIGTQVNLEVDLIARYLERLMLGERAAEVKSVGVTEALLRTRGFISS